MTKQTHPSGLREAHAHLPWLGRALDMLSLEGCSSAPEALDLLGSRVAAVPPGGFLQAHSARVSAWAERTWFDRPALDRVTGSIPALVLSFDHHAVFANTAALERAGIGHRTPDPPGGVIERNASGEPTGLLLESAAFNAWGTAPEPPEATRRSLIERSLDHLSDLGFTEVHDLFSPPWLGPLLAELSKERRAPMRVGLFVPLNDVEEAARARSQWETADLRLLGGKIFTDGTLNSRTAWMLDPYTDAPPGLSHGKPLMNAEQICAAVARCAAHGMGVAMHAIGDGAVRACLDGVERWRSERGHSGGAPIRIEHCEVIARADVPRFAELGVIASVQPCHLLTDIETLRSGLGDRLDRVMPWRDLIDAGLEPGRTLQFGSDVPVVRANPQDSLRAAIKRCRHDGDEPLGPEHAISMSEAERCFAPQAQWA